MVKAALRIVSLENKIDQLEEEVKKKEELAKQLKSDLTIRMAEAIREVENLTTQKNVLQKENADLIVKNA